MDKGAGADQVMESAKPSRCAHLSMKPAKLGCAPSQHDKHMYAKCSMADEYELNPALLDEDMDKGEHTTLQNQGGAAPPSAPQQNGSNSTVAMPCPQHLSLQLKPGSEMQIRVTQNQETVKIEREVGLEKGVPPMVAGAAALQPTEGKAVEGAFRPTQQVLPGTW